MSASGLMVYVSCDGAQEIVRFSMDRATGALSRLGVTKLPAPASMETEDLPFAHLRTTGAPLAVSPDGAFIYAALRKPPFRVVTYRVEPETGSLTWQSETPVPEGTPFITTDRTGRFMFGAAHAGDLVWIGEIEADGRVPASSIRIIDQIVTPHSVLLHPNNRFAYVGATGHNDIVRFHFDASTGALAPQQKSRPGWASDAWPRHLSLHPNNKFLYCMNEASGIIDGFLIDDACGALTRFQSVDGRPADRRSQPGLGADIHVSPDGRFLYGSERASHTLSAYAIDQASGRLSHVQTISAGTIPRSFSIDPACRFLVATGQGSGQIMVFAIDPTSGRLTDLKAYDVGEKPIWVEILDLVDRRRR